MPKINFKDCMVVGIDVHKYSHTAVLMDPFSQVLARYTFNNSIDKLEKFRKSIELKTQNQNVISALEDTGGFGEKLTKFLGQYDCVVYSVPSIYVNNKRKNTPHADKSDTGDAQRVAQVLLQDSERLSQTIINEKTEVTRNLKGLVDDRNQLISDRTGLKNQLHTLLHSYFKDEYRSK